MTRTLRFSLPAVTALFVSILAGNTARSEEVQWATDYNAARKEAAEKGRPLVIDCRKNQCPWCDRLESTTLRDSAVTSMLNKKFVALRLQLEKDPRLIEALGIEAFPTTVLAAADGKILAKLEGFKEAGEFLGHLQRVPTQAPNTDWMDRDYAEASKLYAAKEFDRALPLLKNIVQDGQSRPTQAKARQLKSQIEQEKNELLAQRLLKERQEQERITKEKQEQERIAKLKKEEEEKKLAAAAAAKPATELVRRESATPPATTLVRTLSTEKPEPNAKIRLTRARELLTQARDDYKTQQYLWCLDRCDILMANYGDLPEGVEASQLASQIKSDPELIKQACETQTERLGTLWISLADAALKKGQPDQAAIIYDRVVRMLPGSRQAETAQLRMLMLRGGQASASYEK